MVLDLFRLDNKVAVVTGADTGLGRGIALALSEAGAKVAGVSRAGCAETARRIAQAGGEFLDIVQDVAAPNAAENILSRTRQRFGGVHILVNNAGIIRREDALEFSEKNWDDVLSVNLKALFFLSQAAAKMFVEQKSGGKIINIASMLSYQGGIRVASYTAAKSGVKGLTMTLANEWAKYGINVNAIAPGYMETNNTAQLRADGARSAEILSRIPAGRWGTPDDLKGAAVFLASAASDYVNGFTLAVDGGWLAR